MYSNSRPPRRAEDDAYEADTDTGSRRHHWSDRQTTARHPHDIPLLNTSSSFDEPNDFIALYGSVSYVQEPNNYVDAAPRQYYPGDSPYLHPYGQSVYQRVGVGVEEQGRSERDPTPPPPHNIVSFQLEPQVFDPNFYYNVEEQQIPIHDEDTGPPIQEVDTGRPGMSLKSRLHSIMKAVPGIGSDNNKAARRGIHRRNNSDIAPHSRRPPVHDVSSQSSNQRSHRRTSSADYVTRGKSSLDGASSLHEGVSSRSPLPLHPSQRKSAPPPNTRKKRPSSGGGVVASAGSHNINNNMAVGIVPKPRHRRAESGSSVASLVSILSDRSIISDISKSALYKDRTGSGRVRFHAPIDNVRLVMDMDLVRGRLYRIPGGIDEEDRYVQYTMQNDEQYSNFLLSDDLVGCGCECNACHKCQHKMEQILYPCRYVLQVNDDLYQRVLGEISDSKQPCGLFFCGHHEDVEKPSIFIAVAIVLSFFGTLLLVTYLSHGG